MLVENQPLIPSCRALRPGARIVFINVCPVLKSLPAMGVFVLFASSCNAGISTVRLGAPLAKGIPIFNAAYAYIILGAISSWFDFKPSSNASRDR